MKAWRPLEFGEEAPPRSGLDNRCAYEGCVNPRRNSGRGGIKKYCHGHEKQGQLGKELRPLQNTITKYTPEEYDAVWVLRRKGWTGARIAEYVAISEHFVWNILLGREGCKGRMDGLAKVNR
jgi:hypothetical protein